MTLLALAVLLSQTPEEVTPAPAPEPNPWTAGLTAGITWITGNVISLTAIGGAQATRKTERTIWATKLFGGYGEKYGPLPHEVLLFNAGITSQFDYRFTPVWSAFAGAGLDMDHVKSVEARGYSELGAGATLLDLKETIAEKEQQKVFLKVDLSARLQPEVRFQYYPVEKQVDDVLVFGPRLAVQFHYLFTPTAYVHEELEMLPNVINRFRFLFNSTTKIGVVVGAGFAFTATFNLKYDSVPAAGKKPLDTVLGLGVEAAF